MSGDSPIGGPGGSAGHTRAGGVDEEHALPPVGQRGRHQHAGRKMGGRHAHRRAVEAPARAVACRGDTGGEGARPDLGERRGEDRLALDDAGQPAGALFGCTELGDRQRAHGDGRQQRHRRHPSSLLLEQQAQLDDPVTAPADVLGQCDAQQVGIGQLRPQGPVDPVGSSLDLLHPLGRGLIGEDPRRQVGDRLLILGKGEVHQPGAGWNWGNVSSSSKATISSSRGMPTRTSAGSTPITLDTSRVPSSSWTRPTTRG